jgi:hypothetical protein
MMSQFSLSPDMSMEVTARFIAKGTDAPLTGAAYKVRLFDKDIFDDDYIGESGLDSTGVAKIKFTHKAFGDLGNLETMPDLYFAVVKNDVQVFESKVMKEIDVVALEHFKMGEGEVIDLGTFLVEG